MFRNKTKIILIIVLIFQFISPLGLLIYQANIQNKLNTLEANVRLEVDSISTDVGYITVEPRIYYEDAVNIDEYLSNFAEDYNYISFVGYDNEGYSKYSLILINPIKTSMLAKIFMIFILLKFLLKMISKNWVIATGISTTKRTKKKISQQDTSRDPKPKHTLI